MSTPSWWITPERRPLAEIRLFAFPYAGGSAGSFRAWAKRLSPRIELSVLQLPGREDRYHEPMLTSMAEVVPPVCASLSHRADKPFVLFGHSLGALMAFEVVRRLAALGQCLPLELVVGGKRAPHVPIDRTPLHELNDADLIDRLRRFGGTPQAVLDTPELLELFLPRLRADFQINETYRHTEGAKLSVPVTVLGGVDDPETTPETLQAWQRHADGGFRLRMYPGGHFFIHQIEDRVLGDIQQLVLTTLAQNTVGAAW